jgi:hypothetical protein
MSMPEASHGAFSRRNVIVDVAMGCLSHGAGRISTRRRRGQRHLAIDRQRGVCFHSQGLVKSGGEEMDLAFGGALFLLVIMTAGVTYAYVTGWPPGPDDRK